MIGREAARSFYGFLIFSLLCTAIAPLYGACGSTQAWNGGDTITASVLDQNVAINGGAITISGGVHISALTCDVVVDINADSYIQGTPSGPSRFYVDAALDHTVTFSVTNNLTFQGSANGTDLLMTFSGLGKIVFEIAGDQTLTFTQNDDGGSVQAFLLMQTPVGNALPTLEFARQSCTEGDVQIIIGPNALLSYAAMTPVPDTNNEQGLISFNPANAITNNSNFILNIQNTGGFIVMGHYLNGGLNPLLGNFDLSILAGTAAQAQVANSEESCKTRLARAYCPDTPLLPANRLLVLNYNTTLSELLFDPWFNLGARTDLVNYAGAFTGVQYGFIVNANGQLIIGNDAYLDYVGLSCNVCPTPDGVTSSQVKPRNPSALIIDGSHNPAAVPGQIIMGNESGLFFRAGVDNDCVLTNSLGSPHEFTISFTNRTLGAGQIVFDIEGELNVIGSNSQIDENNFDAVSKIEVLSLEVTATGGPLFIGQAYDIFPLRTFATDEAGDYYRYNAAAVLINNDCNLTDVSLVHTDQNHNVYEKNDVVSEPTYVGGDTYAIGGLPTPALNFYNAQLMVNENIAFTGFDLWVPNGLNGSACGENISRFIFFYNGFVIDDGNGRQMILGTDVGAYACDETTLINNDAQLNVMQTSTCVESDDNHWLRLESSPNDGTITQGLARLCPDDTSPIQNQFSVNDLYLGHTTNITVGEIPAQVSFPLTSHPSLIIHGNYFSFSTRGGLVGMPEASNETGQGGIFVDSDGTFSIDPTYRASMATMVTRSGTAQINLPLNQTFWANRIGIADWELNLSDPSRQVTVDGVVMVPIIAAQETFSDYTLDWMSVTKDYSIFTPYELAVFNPCSVPAATLANVQALPTVQGTVDQFQIAGSRLGSMAYLAVDGGWVKELVFILDHHAAEEPTAGIVVRNNGRIGLGTADRNTDSVFAAIVLGVNGVTIIADGDGLIDVNEDLIINNVCSIIKGPNFNGNTLRLHSERARTIRIKSTGTLDLTTFTQADDVIELIGDLRLVLEPGAKIIFGGVGADVPGGACDSQVPTPGGILRVTENALIQCEAAASTDLIFTVTAHGPHVDGAGDELEPGVPHDEFGNHFCRTMSETETIRAKLAGKGTLELAGCARMIVDSGAYLGIQTIDPSLDPEGCEVITTNIALTISDQAHLSISDGCAPVGGVFQVGDSQLHEYVCDDDVTKTATVAFTLTIDGLGAKFSIGSQGFFGMGVGIVDNSSPIPNDWLVDLTYSVASLELHLFNGAFAHERTFTGDSANAALMMLGTGRDNDIDYLFTGDITDLAILGGGNFALLTPYTATPPAIDCAIPDPITDIVAAVHPIVRDDAGVTPDPRLTVGILGSKPLVGFPPFVAATAQAAFDYMRTKNIRASDIGQAFGRSNAAASLNNTKFYLGFVDAGNDGTTVATTPGKIGRYEFQNIVGNGGNITKLEQALQVGGVGGMVFENDAAAPPRVPKVVYQLSETIFVP